MNNESISTTITSCLMTNYTESTQKDVDWIEPWFKTCTFSILLATCIIGSLVNLFVAFIIIKRRKIKRVIHFLTLNLAISDLMVLLIYLPIQLKLYDEDLKWYLGRTSCRFFYMISAITVNASICTLIAITRDRYIAISYPMMIHSRGLASIKCWISIIWLVSFVMTLPLLFVVDVDEGYCYESKWPNLSFERVYWITMFAMQIIFPLICFTISYTIIIHRLGKDTKFLASERGRRRCQTMRQKRKLLQMAIMLTVIYIICSLPQHLVFFAGTFGVLQHTHDFAVYVFVTSNFLMILQSALNPIVYSSQSEEVKRALYKVFPCFKSSYFRIKSRLRNRRLRHSLSIIDKSLTNRVTSPTRLSEDMKVKVPLNKLK